MVSFSRWYGEPPEEVDALCQLMELKVRLRALRVRGLEAGPGRVVLSLGPEAALDPFRLARHVQQSGGALRLTPEMKLVARVDGAAPRPAASSAPSIVRRSPSRSRLCPMTSMR